MNKTSDAQTDIRGRTCHYRLAKSIAKMPFQAELFRFFFFLHENLHYWFSLKASRQCMVS